MTHGTHNVKITATPEDAIDRIHKVTKKNNRIYHRTLQNEAFLKYSLCLSAFVARFYTLSTINCNYSAFLMNIGEKRSVSGVEVTGRVLLDSARRTFAKYTYIEQLQKIEKMNRYFNIFNVTSLSPCRELPRVHPNLHRSIVFMNRFSGL